MVHSKTLKEELQVEYAGYTNMLAEKEKAPYDLKKQEALQKENEALENSLVKDHEDLKKL